ncbi:MAG: PP0621 family protein [Sulfurimonas sp.]|nr:PP0621 family protein [Sulfurimonas sp.]
MILKVLLVLLVIGIVYFMFIKKKPLPTTKKDENEKLESNDMVQCVSCGTYAELGETIISSNKYYCSSQCVDKG